MGIPTFQKFKITVTFASSNFGIITATFTFFFWSKFSRFHGNIPWHLQVPLQLPAVLILLLNLPLLQWLALEKKFTNYLRAVAEIVTSPLRRHFNLVKSQFCCWMYHFSWFALKTKFILAKMTTYLMDKLILWWLFLIPFTLYDSYYHINFFSLVA